MTIFITIIASLLIYACVSCVVEACLSEKKAEEKAEHDPDVAKKTYQSYDSSAACASFCTSCIVSPDPMLGPLAAIAMANAAREMRQIQEPVYVPEPTPETAFVMDAGPVYAEPVEEPMRPYDEGSGDYYSTPSEESSQENEREECSDEE